MITQQERQQIESSVKQLIQESVMAKLADSDVDGTGLNKFALSQIYLTDIMALGYNNSSVNHAANDIFELQSQMPWLTVNKLDIHRRVEHTLERFPEEVEGFSTMVTHFSLDTNKDSIIEVVADIINN